MTLWGEAEVAGQAMHEEARGLGWYVLLGQGRHAAWPRPEANLPGVQWVHPSASDCGNDTLDTASVPAGQGVHCAALVLVNPTPAQLWHIAAPKSSEVDPTRHCVQFSDPGASAYVPGAQGTQDELPTAIEDVPGGQGAQEAFWDAPPATKRELYPGGQG